MPTLETLTQADLAGALSRASLKKAQGYLGRVQNPVRSGQTLTAQVRGSSLYEVEIDVKPSGIAAICSCPYTWGGYCKHIGAVLLKWVQSPSAFRSQDAVPRVVQPAALELTPVEPPPSSRPKELPYWVQTALRDWQQASDKQLAGWLEKTKLNDLREIAIKRGWSLKGTRKADIVEQLLPQLTDPAQTLKAVLGLDDEHRCVLRAMALLGDNATIQPEAVAQAAQLWGRLAAYKQVETYTRHLCGAGLAMPGSVWGDYYRRTDFIPQAIMRSLPPALQDCLSSADELLAHIPADQIDLADPYALPRTALQVLTLLEQMSPPLRPPMPRPRLEKFYPALQVWDYEPAEIQRAEQQRWLQSPNLTLTVPPPAFSLPDDAIARLAPLAGGAARLEFIYTNWVATGLLQPGSPVTTWPEVKIEFLRRDELAQRAIMARAFLFSAGWSALWDVLRDPSSPLVLKRRASHHYVKPRDLIAQLYGFRHAALRVLASVPDGQWVVLDDLFSVLQVVWPRFDQAAWQTYAHSGYQPAWFLAIKGSDQPLTPGNTQHWALAQGNFVRALIRGPLHWLGLADLCWRNGQLVAVRFHGLADIYWERVEAPPAPRHSAHLAESQVRPDAVQTDHHTITVHPTSVSGQTHGLLDQIAHLETATSERFVYRLDAQAAYQSFEKGASLAGLLSAWKTLVPIPMPEAIRIQLTQWWEAYGRVRVYENLTVIEFGDDYALAELQATTSLDQFLIATISPRLVIIDEDGVDVLKADLEKAGYTPKVTSDE
jgi:hypothetical protein